MGEHTTGQDEFVKFLIVNDENKCFNVEEM